MRIAFINPNLNYAPVPNLGLAYLISSIEAKYRVNLIDLTFHSRGYQRYLIDRLKDNPPDVVGISVTTFSYAAGLNIASLVKQLYPEVQVIFGGVHPTLLPEEILGHPQVDAICIGEGEEAILEYLNCLQEHLPPRGVAGIWYKEEGQLIRNPLRPFKKDLDNLPFPNWDYWELEKYFAMDEYLGHGLMHLASRGCPYNCSFCSAPVIRKANPGRYYRLRNSEDIIREIKINQRKYQNRGLKNVVMLDATFGLDEKQLNDFCNLFMKEGLNRHLTWTCQSRADVITSRWAKNASIAGCVMVTLGIESGDEYIRTKIYNKKIKQEQIENAVNYLQENNILYQFDLMVGCPEETIKTIKKSLELIKKFNPISAYFTPFQPLPKTDLTLNYSRGATLSQKNHLGFKKIMWRIRKEFICMFFQKGFKMKGVKFVLDIIRYFFSMGILRTLPLMSPYLRIELTQKTIYKYALENIKRNRKNKDFHA